MKQILRLATLSSVLMLALVYLGCEDDDVVLPQVSARYTFTNTDGSGVVTFINTSENASTYEWSFGDTTTSTEINPTKVYDSSGVYTVTLKALNVSGATDEFSSDVTINIPDASILLNFDDVNIDTSTDLTFGTGTTFEVVTNPDLSGANTVASNVGRITTTGEAFQGVTFPFETPVDFSGDNKTIELKFWSNSPTDVLVKFSGGLDTSRESARDVEVLVSHGGTGWETLTFNFATDAVTSFIDGAADNGQPLVPDGQYANLDVFVGFNQAFEGTVYVDDIIQITSDSSGGGGTGGTLAECSGGTLVNDFETATDAIFDNFGGGVGTIIDNADTSVNTSAKVGQYVKGAGEVFGGITIALDSNIDFNAGTFSIDVNSQAVRQLLFKLEGLNIELIVPTSGTGWETIDYDFSSVSGNAGSVTGITLIMDNGTAGDGSADWTIQFDNIRLCSNGASGGGGTGGTLAECSGGTLVNDFETADDTIFDNFGGGVGTIIDNADTSVNTSARVGQYVKNAGEVFGGITIALDSNIDFNAGTFSIDVNSQAVRQLLFKLEGLNIELIVPTSGTGWETIDYDFSSVSGNVGSVTGITLIMDNGTAGDGSADWTIQFDNIRLCSNGASGGGSTLVECSGGDLVNDFETATDAIFDNFGGGVGTIIDNADTSVNTSAKVGQYVKNAGEVFGGITIALDSNIDFNAGTFSIDVNSQAVRQLLFKLEGLNIELIVATSGTGWETIDYDFSSVSGNVGSVTGITLIMDNGTAGDGSADWTIQFDNIRLCSNGSSGGGGSTPSDAPTSAAPTPPSRNAADVISIYSDAYANINVTNWSPGFGDSNGPINEVSISGNNTRVIELSASQTFGAIDFASTSIDLSTFTHMHLDYFIPNPLPPGVVVIPKLSNHAGGMGETSAIQVTHVVTSGGTWVSLDLELSSFTAAAANGILDREAIAQILFTISRAAPASAVNVYFDNLYFYK